MYQVNNKHNVPKEVIESRLKKYKTIIPYYFGWFLNEEDSLFLIDQAKCRLNECFDQFNELKEDFNSKNGTFQIRLIVLKENQFNKKQFQFAIF